MHLWVQICVAVRERMRVLLHRASSGYASAKGATIPTMNGSLAPRITMPSVRRRLLLLWGLERVSLLYYHLTL